MSTLAHIAYLAGIPCERPLRYQSLIDLGLGVTWGAIAYWQCGKSWLLFGLALIGCYVRLEKALRVAATANRVG